MKERWRTFAEKMKIETEKLINDLKNRSLQNLKDAHSFRALDIVQLNKRENNSSWSILECIEHLNLYGDFYLAEIAKKLNKNAHLSAVKHFKSGLIGDYFAKMMLPEAKKMKTFKDKDPIGSKLSISSIDKFIKQQEKTLKLLDQASKCDLNRIRTSISISKLIRLKIGDTLRVVVYHNQRHMEQAKRVLQLES